MLNICHFLPFIPKELAKVDSLNLASSNAPNIDNDLTGDQGDDSSQGIAECLIEGAKFFNEVERPVSQAGDFVHQAFVVISAESEAVNAENSEVFVVFLF